MVATIISVIMLLGAPGAGKGTQAEKISKTLNIPHISTGQILRDEMADPNSELGSEAKKIISSGGFLDDSIINGMLKVRINKEDCKNGYLLDGYPRNIPQAETLSTLLTSKPTVINLSLPDDEIEERIVLRRTCKTCGAVYHLKYSPPKKEGICDKDGGELYQRDDDTKESLKTRLALYHEKTQPLIDFYQKQGTLHTVECKDKSIDQVFEEVKVHLPK